jgi:hypothetical protein
VSANVVVVESLEEHGVASAGGEDRPRTAPRAAVRWAVLTVVFLVVLELTCRIEDWVRFGTPFLTPITSQSDLIMRDREGMHGRPNARFQKWVMNGLGTRGPAAAAAKAPGSVRVVVAGASETFGLSESPGMEFPRQLEDTLGRWLADRCRTTAVQRFEVLNAALPGMSLPTIEQDVRNRIRRFGADVILLYPTPVQYLDDEPPYPAPPDSAADQRGLSLTRAWYPRIVPRIRNETKAIIPDVVLTWLRRRQTSAYIGAQPSGWRFTSLPTDRLQQYDADLRRFIGTVRSLGAAPVIATHGNLFMRPGLRDSHMLAAWEKFYPRATAPVIVAFDSAARELTLQAARDSAVTVADVAPRLAGIVTVPFSDFAHFTDSGAAIVASSLAPAVLKASGVGEPCGVR